jgi:hypothetical protein
VTLTPSMNSQTRHESRYKKRTLTPSMNPQTLNESRYKKTHPNSVPFCTAHNTHATLQVNLITFLLVYLPIYLRSILLFIFFSHI